MMPAIKAVAVPLRERVDGDAVLNSNEVMESAAVGMLDELARLTEALSMPSHTGRGRHWRGRWYPMKAVVFDKHGPPEVLKIVDLEKPRPGPGQVRVRVRAAGIQPFDTGVRQGSLGFPVSFPQQLGNEFSGVVDRVGEGVSEWSEGDEVLGWAFMASLAEYAAAGVAAVVRKPAAGGFPSVANAIWELSTANTQSPTGTSTSALGVRFIPWTAASGTSIASG